MFCPFLEPVTWFFLIVKVTVQWISPRVIGFQFQLLERVKRIRLLTGHWPWKGPWAPELDPAICEKWSVRLYNGGVMLHNGCWYLEILECDQSDYTRGSNTSHWLLIYSAILGMWSVRLYEGIIEVELIYREGARPGRVSRLKFPLKDREPRWQGSTTFSDSCLFMISNLVNPLFHCNSQYSWYRFESNWSDGEKKNG